MSILDHGLTTSNTSHYKGSRPLRLLQRVNKQRLSKLSQKLGQKRTVKKKKYILCAQCKFIVTSIEEQTKVSGQFKHSFKNPAGIIYTIGCYGSAKGGMIHGEPTNEHTWFPGYAWSYVLCINCSAHLGWYFQSGEHSFFGLILNNLTEAEK